MVQLRQLATRLAFVATIAVCAIGLASLLVASSAHADPICSIRSGDWRTGQSYTREMTTTSNHPCVKESYEANPRTRIMGVRVISPPQHGTVTPRQGGWTYQSHPGYQGADTFAVTLQTNYGPATFTYKVTVRPADPQPAIGHLPAPPAGANLPPRSPPPPAASVLSPGPATQGGALVAPAPRAAPVPPAPPAASSHPPQGPSAALPATKGPGGITPGPGKQAANINAPVGSSRVDLQACKLEYSIVSPK